MNNPMLLNNTYNLLVVFLYRMLQNPIMDDDNKTKAYKLINKLILQKHLPEQELLKIFLPVLEEFLGKSEQFKKILQEATNQIQELNFNVEDILTAFLTQFTDLTESLVQSPSADLNKYIPAFKHNKNSHKSTAHPTKDIVSAKERIFSPSL